MKKCSRINCVNDSFPDRNLLGNPVCITCWDEYQRYWPTWVEGLSVDEKDVKIKEFLEGKK